MSGAGRMAAALAVAVGAAQALGQATGPDLIAGSVTDLRYWGTLNGVNAYSIGVDACNLGDTPVNWVGNTNQHSVVAQNIYRIKYGRFVQIGQGWVKHGHSSANANNCGTCQLPPGGSSQLGVSCSDTYDAGLNGWQILLGPRSEINASTGDFPYPFGSPPINTILDRRIQVAVTDVEDTNNPGAVYFAEAVYVAPDDALAGNGLNNASYQQISFPTTSVDPVMVGAPVQMQPAIAAWAAGDPTVQLSAAEYTDSSAGPAVTARFWVGGRASDNGNGTWHYEYAIFNLNADRAAGSFSVPVPALVSLSNFGFHAPLSHSGEPYSNDPWTNSVDGTGVTFSTTPYASDPNANAVRWGTSYNVRFDATTPPMTGAATLGLFKPGSPSSVSVSNMPVPSPVNQPPPCYANCDGSTAVPVLNVADFSCFLTRFSAADPYANCDGSTMAPVLNILDFNCFLRSFAQGCP